MTPLERLVSYNVICLIILFYITKSTAVLNTSAPIRYQLIDHPVPVLDLTQRQSMHSFYHRGKSVPSSTEFFFMKPSSDVTYDDWSRPDNTHVYCEDECWDYVTSRYKTTIHKGACLQEIRLNDEALIGFEIVCLIPNVPHNRAAHPPICPLPYFGCVCIYDVVEFWTPDEAEGRIPPILDGFWEKFKFR